MMEKAKTASSTSHSSETRWRGTMHFHQSSPGRAQSLRRSGAQSQTRSPCLSQWQWRMALVFSSRWNMEVMGGGGQLVVLRVAAPRCRRRRQQCVPHPSNDSW